MFAPNAVDQKPKEETNIASGVPSKFLDLTEDELNTQFDKKYSYNADFILIIEDADTPIPKSILRDNKFSFGSYVSTLRNG